MRKHVVVVGGGPAGLTAAYALTKEDIEAVVLERDAQVGGHARTARHAGFLFDVGGHRFFTKIPEVERIWREVMEARFLRVKRLSRILYRGRFFHYPLKPLEALRQLGLLESAWVVASYLRKRIFPIRRESNLEDWMSNRFGRRLFLMFFKTYTEKVWGLKCTDIRPEWAAQRIKTLTLGGALRKALLPGGRQHRSLIEEFNYPEKGPGMLWERMACLVREAGGEVVLEQPVVSVRRTGFRVDSVVTSHDGHQQEWSGTHFLSSMPLQELILSLDPPASPEIQADARALKYRDFITVALMIHRSNVFPDNWIYVHTPELQVGRIQNYKNWSASMVPDPYTTCLGMEYFCNEGDALWSRSDEELVELARREVMAIGFARPEEIFDGAVLRQKKAYPVYDPEYRGHLDRLREYLLRFENLQMIGRNGLHKYDNQDHAMLTALLAVKNILGESHDVWGVNTAHEYLEVQPNPSAD